MPFLLLHKPPSCCSVVPWCVLPDPALHITPECLRREAINIPPARQGCLGSGARPAVADFGGDPFKGFHERYEASAGASHGVRAGRGQRASGPLSRPCRAWRSVAPCSVTVEPEEAGRKNLTRTVGTSGRHGFERTDICTFHGIIATFPKVCLLYDAQACTANEVEIRWCLGRITGPSLAHG